MGQIALEGSPCMGYTEASGNIMNTDNCLLTLQSDCETVITEIKKRLSGRGYTVMRSFDLKSACASYPDLICPHHGEPPCDCQLVVLLVYENETSPVSLVIHSHRGQTEVTKVTFPDTQSDPELNASIRSTMENMTSRQESEYRKPRRGS